MVCYIHTELGSYEAEYKCTLHKYTANFTLGMSISLL